MTCYTDGNGNYFMPGEADAASPGMTTVETCSQGEGRGTILLASASLPLAGWVAAPGLSDVGGGVWTSDGLMVDPEGN